MPIPIRTQSPSKPDPVKSNAAGTSCNGNPIHNNNSSSSSNNNHPHAKEPTPATRLTRDAATPNPVSSRATNISNDPDPPDGQQKPRPHASSRNTVGYPRPGSVLVTRPGAGAGAGAGAGTGPGGGYSTTRMTGGSSITRKGTGLSSTQKSGTTMPSSTSLEKDAAAKSHSHVLSASTRPNAETRHSQAASKTRLNPGARTTITRPASSTKGAPIASFSQISTPATLLKKPVFDAFNQHYSPKRPSKPAAPAPSITPPHSSTHLLAIPPSAAAQDLAAAPAANLVNLRGELLQLTLVWRPAATTLQAYEQTVTAALSCRCQELETRLRTLKFEQRDRQAKVNALAAQRWLEEEDKQNSPLEDLAKQKHKHTGHETLLVLARCLKELHEVSKQDGPLASAMQAFDEWQTIYASSRSAATRMSAPDFHDDDDDDGGCNMSIEQSCLRESSNMAFVAPLDPRWSALVLSVQGRVRGCAALLANLHKPPKDSSIGLLIKMHSTLVEQILREIAICRDVEGLILRREQERLEVKIANAMSDVESQLPSSGGQAGRKGIWDTR